jgi:MerR family regulatory protein
MAMCIRELAAKTGTTTRTLRYYEAQGLLPTGRSANGYRPTVVHLAGEAPSSLAPLHLLEAGAGAEPPQRQKRAFSMRGPMHSYAGWPGRSWERS